MLQESTFTTTDFQCIFSRYLFCCHILDLLQYRGFYPHRAITTVCRRCTCGVGTFSDVSFPSSSSLSVYPGTFPLLMATILQSFLLLAPPRRPLRSRRPLISPLIAGPLSLLSLLTLLSLFNSSAHSVPDSTFSPSSPYSYSSHSPSLLPPLTLTLSSLLPLLIRFTAL